VIVRILGEGQFRVDDDAAAKLTALDKDLDAAVRDQTDAAFSAALRAAVALVRATGEPVADDEFVTADYILPFSTPPSTRCASSSPTARFPATRSACRSPRDL